MSKVFPKGQREPSNKGFLNSPITSSNFSGVGVFVDKYLVSPLYAASNIFICWFSGYLGLLAIYRFITVSGLSLTVAAISLLLALWLTRPLLSWLAACYGLAIIAFCVMLMIPLDYFWDAEWDSAAFHLPAISELMRGWNPTRESQDIIWLSTYPNGWWTLQATAATLLASFGLSVESARIMNYLLLPITLGLVLAAVRALTNKLSFSVWLLILAAIAHPIVMTQSHTHMMDGSLYLLCICLMASLTLWFMQPSRMHAGQVASCIILLISIKMSGVYFAAVICAIMLVGWMIAQRRLPIKQSIFCLIIAIFVMSVVCYRPFITNLLDYSAIVYPPPSSHIFVVEDIRLIPAPLRFVALIAGHHAAGTLNALVWKYPWEFRLSDFIHMSFPSVSYGGFGAAFPLICSLALLVAVASIRPLTRYKQALIVAIGLLLISFAVFSGNWLARYLPLVWLLPVLFLAMPWFNQTEQRNWLTWCSAAVAILMLANSAFSYAYAARWFYHEYYRMNDIIEQSLPLVLLTYIPNTQGLNTSGADGIWQQRLHHRNIRFKLIDKANCEGGLHLSGGIDSCGKSNRIP